MSAFIYTIPLSLVTSLVGKEVISTAIRETSSSIYTAMYGLVDSKYPEIDKVLNQLDIKAQISSIESLIANIKYINDTIHLLLNYLHQIICDINDDLTKINFSIKTHKEKYFNKWRTPAYLPYLKKLKRDHIILEKRLKMLIQVLSVNQHLS